MKKSLNIYQKIIEETDSHYLVIYHLDQAQGTYEEIMRINAHFLQLEQEPTEEHLTSIEIFHKVRHCLKQGRYFCVSKGASRSDWFTVDVPSPEDKTSLEDLEN